MAAVTAAVVLTQVALGGGSGDVVDASGLPATVDSADGSATIPDEGPVGRGEMLYQCRECDVMLVLDSGEQLALTEDLGFGALTAFSLSPDGRWLAHGGPGGTVVRDLIGEERHFVAAPLGPVVWSGESRWLLLVEFGSGDAPAGYFLVDTDDGSLVEAAVIADHDYVAVLPGGELIALDRMVGAEEPVAVVHGEVVVPGREATSSLVIDAEDWLEPGETLVEAGQLGGVQFVLDPAGEGAYLSVFTGTSPVALLRVTLAGEVTDRVSLAFPSERGWWALEGQLDGQLVVSRAHIPEPRSFARTLYAVLPDGELQELTIVSGADMLRLPGTGAFGGSML
ncbi:hypothetical protein JQS43_18545 [Natronosporangium hydrolyticum]|uniref:WD40 repeat domain-containing protein n=1 Tax=Natronosporangium hydrolyticum TaxID=2811111 RepID=A0A895YS00_9ACTN|nr:hypothetical protein [Natronosporangium hydrolyticum]QSB17586.1 hypothetical protein JQS43_18545 [Natronosporangium hydrolyticum]